MQNHNTEKKIKTAQVSLPKGGGAIRGIGETFQPDEFSGTASLAIPIISSPCRDFEPRLSVDYSSGSGNGVFGIGFGLSIPNIARKTSKGIPTYTEKDTFILSGTEDLVPIAETTTGNTKTIRYRPRVDNLFANIEQHIHEEEQKSQSYWQVITKDNVTHLYGRTQQAQIHDPDDPTHVFQWLLEEGFDAKGNHIYYQYKAENTSGIAEMVYEKNRVQTANKYIHRICYGNAASTQQIISERSDQQPTWHFEIVFDYGQYDISATHRDPFTPIDNQTWQARQDPFSTYHAGFEIRTQRLCRSILMFHRFKEFGATPILVGATQFHYDENPSLTRLTSVSYTGYRYRQGQPYETKSLPPLNFTYTRFERDDPHRQFKRLRQENGQALPGFNSTPDYQMIDLYGEGVAGILYGDGQSVLYWEPTKGMDDQPVSHGVASYALPDEPPSWPVTRLLETATQQLVDLEGDGRPDLMLSTPQVAGYFTSQPNHSWTNFQPFPSFPTNYHQPNQHLVDVTGDGLADLLRIEARQVRVYPSKGKQGFGQAISAPQRPDWPLPKTNSVTEALRFADMLGTGQQHLVRITKNAVECWPNLGYGRFAKKVTLGGAPDLGADFDTSRLFLADVDGSGTADLIYLAADKPDQIVIWLNQSGNSFSQEPLVVTLPQPFDRLDHISFADVYGQGSDCLIFSKGGTQPNDWCYDFCQGQKPYLLNEIDNNRGAKTAITYRSSVHFYLKDKSNQLPWITTLPFPVQVVAQIENQDLISKTTLITTYDYHHGYYDGSEREFRGFGRVDRIDSASFANFSPADQAMDAVYRSPPRLTKTWYHTGAWLTEQALESQYTKEYWAADSHPYQGPATTFHYQLNQPDSDDVRQAYRALHGTVLRSEVYGCDATPWQTIPYSVAETQFKVLQLQRRKNHPYGIYTIHVQQKISFDYERNPADPRIEHEFIFNVDDYGEVRQSCTVHYGRRQGKGLDLDPQTRAQQQSLTGLCEETDYFHSPEVTPQFYLLGVPLSQKQVEIKSLSLPQDHYFSFDELRQQVDSALTTKSDYQLLHWQRNYYYDADKRQELPLGQVPAQELHCRTETAVFEKAKLNADFQDVLTPTNLEQLLTTGDQQATGGYLSFQQQDANAYYWNPGDFQAFGDADQFYLPHYECDPFQYAAVNHTVKQPSPELSTRYQYDESYLLMTKVTDPLNNSTQVTGVDYQTLQPTQIKDINGNLSEVLFDPLGMVMATSFYGTEGNQTLGFAPLDSYRPKSASTVQAVLNQPDAYLQKAASFFYYDTWAWVERNEPVHSVHLMAEDYTQGRDGFPLDGVISVVPSEPRIQVQLNYFDGFERILQSKTHVLEAGEAYRQNSHGHYRLQDHVSPRWHTSGAVRYNNKGKPIQQFEPYFVDSPGYTPHTVGVATTLFYDALDRVILTETPKNQILTHQTSVSCFSKTLLGELVSGSDPLDTVAVKGYLNEKLYGGLAQTFQPSPWSALHFDENNTLLESDYYRAVMTDTPLSQTLPVKEKATLTEAARFYNYATQQHFDNLAREIQVVRLNAARKQVTPVEGSQSYRLLDVVGNPLTESDARLHPQGKANFSTIYDLDGQGIKSRSSDAGTHWQLHDVVGNLIYRQDLRGTGVKHAYDALRRPTQVYLSNPSEGLDQSVERIFYGDSLVAGKPLFDPIASQAWNLRGKTILYFDQAGLSVTGYYSLHGLPLAVTQALRKVTWAKDRLLEADWNGVDATPLAQLAQQLQNSDPDKLNQLSPVVAEFSDLEPNLYTHQARYDGLGRVIQEADPDHNLTLTDYDSLGQLKALKTVPGKRAKGATAPEIQSLTYNAKGQPQSITYGNAVTTHYRYDSYTFELRTIKTTRPQQGDLQDLSYSYDPVGNVTYVHDQVLPSVFYKGKVTPEASYRYDPLYRLTEASGREQAAMWANVQHNHNKSNAALFNTLAQQLSNPQAIQRYTQTFTYDASGNLSKIQHSTGSTRHLQMQPHSNRLQSCRVGSQSITQYDYDANGNQQTLTAGQNGYWNYRNNIQSVTLVQRQHQPADVEGYVYDSHGRRTRKLRRTLINSGKAFHISEVIYLGHFEIRRTWRQAAQTPQASPVLKSEWRWNRLMADDHCVGVWGYMTHGDSNIAKPTQLRYQLNNHLGSSTMELNEQGHIITYEEYYPYGGTAFIAAKGKTLEIARVEVKSKHYRYSGKELDEATGLCYYGMRYYAPWLGRWLSADPAGTVDGLNLYGFVSGNPATYMDAGGMVKFRQKDDPTLKPHIKRHQEIVGQTAVEKQKRGVTPTAAEVRVRAVKRSRTTMGQGLHEPVPTNMRDKIAKIADPAMREEAAHVQSGLRTTPALTPMNNPSGGTCGHTGTYVSPSAPKKSLYTSGQGPAHDKLRQSFDRAIATGRPHQLMTDMAVAQLEGIPHGQKLLADPNFSALPTNLNVSNPREYAAEVHWRREKVKDRIRTTIDNDERKTGIRARSPSPERDDMTSAGGGGYSTRQRARTPEPDYPSTSRTAHRAAWVSQPLRLSN